MCCLKVPWGEIMSLVHNGIMFPLLHIEVRATSKHDLDSPCLTCPEQSDALRTCNQNESIQSQHPFIC